MRPLPIPIRLQLKEGEHMPTPLKGMKTVVVLLGAILSVVWSVAAPTPVAALEVGDKAPDFTLPGTTGEKISLNQFRGKSWSSWSFTALISRRCERRTSRPGRPTTASSWP